jgi:hypothetical protein
MKPRQQLDELLRRLPQAVISGDAKFASDYKKWASKAMKARANVDINRFIGEYRAMDQKERQQ